MGHYGIVYIARNDKHPENVYKIGGSARSVDDRMAELNRETGTFGKFEAKAYFPVTDWEKAESICHRQLSKYREDKEFFSAPYQQLLKIVRNVCKELEPKASLGSDGDASKVKVTDDVAADYEPPKTNYEHYSEKGDRDRLRVSAEDAADPSNPRTWDDHYALEDEIDNRIIDAKRTKKGRFSGIR